jgi:DNA-binding NarL/FixJ family response regulator
MDINMSEMQGDEVTELALEKNPDLKIIALTMFSDLTHYTQMIQAGVQGFIIKKASKKELQNAIETVFYGGHYFSDEILKKLAVQSIHNRSFFKEQLTEREKQILQLMCEGKTTVEISGILFISNKTVETHRTHIFKKAKVRNIAELVVWAIKNNYFSI